MGQRVRILSVVAAVATLAVLVPSCATGVDTGEVKAGSASDRVALATSTTLTGVGGAAATGAASRSGGSKGKGNNADLASTATKLISQITSDPNFLSRIAGGDQAALAAITGLDPEVLKELQITPDTVRGLATILTAVDPDTRAKLASGVADPELLGLILALAGDLDPASASALKGASPAAIAAILSTAMNVDPKVLDAMGSVLMVVDPGGLGALANDRSALAIMAVMFGAALRVSPNEFQRLANLNDPNVNFVINGVTGLVAGLTPTVVNQINGLAKVLGPDLLKAMGAMIGLMGRPDVAPVVQAAAADPVVLVTTLGVASLLVPGLAETLAPSVFVADPNARYKALVGLLGVAIANIAGLDLDALALQLGLPPLSDDFKR